MASSGQGHDPSAPQTSLMNCVAIRPGTGTDTTYNKWTTYDRPHLTNLDPTGLAGTQCLVCLKLTWLARRLGWRRVCGGPSVCERESEREAAIAVQHPIRIGTYIERGGNQSALPCSPLKSAGRRVETKEKHLVLWESWDDYQRWKWRRKCAPPACEGYQYSGWSGRGGSGLERPKYWSISSPDSKSPDLTSGLYCDRYWMDPLKCFPAFNNLNT